MRELESRTACEKKSRKVACGADARGGEVHFLRVRLSPGDEALQIRDALDRIRIEHAHEADFGNHADRAEFFARIKRNVRIEERIDAEDGVCDVAEH